MQLFASRSGVIERDQGLVEGQVVRASTVALDDEPYLELTLVDPHAWFTAEEEAFFAEGDELDRAAEDDELW